MRIEITVPSSNLGDINSDMSGRRGRVLGMDSAGGDLLVEYPLENEIIKAKETINLKVLDRSELILQIFGLHAAGLDLRERAADVLLPPALHLRVEPHRLAPDALIDDGVEADEGAVECGGVV